jgi:3-carboxy-cis,cis-muconate cycloisomerase
VLLAQTEVAEASERGDDGRGGSSAMPQKQNPVGAVAVLACAQRGPGLVATILSAMVQEHERAAGAWQAEWEPLLELLRLTGSAATSMNELLADLSVDPIKMAEDLEITGNLLMSESVAVSLAPSIGRPAAQQLVATAARRSAHEGRPFREVLLEDHQLADSLGPSGLDRALDPRRYLGATEALIDRALAAHRKR